MRDVKGDPGSRPMVIIIPPLMRCDDTCQIALKFENGICQIAPLMRFQPNGKDNKVPNWQLLEHGKIGHWRHRINNN